MGTGKDVSLQGMIHISRDANFKRITLDETVS
jgi:tartrate dehydratase beta subunit/fumarate hydratase class I family protein